MKSKESEKKIKFIEVESTAENMNDTYDLAKHFTNIHAQNLKNFISDDVPMAYMPRDTKEYKYMNAKYRAAKGLISIQGVNKATAQRLFNLAMHRADMLSATGRNQPGNPLLRNILTGVKGSEEAEIEHATGTGLIDRLVNPKKAKQVKEETE